MRILLVEDDPTQSDDITKAIQGAYAKAQITLLRTEHQCCEHFDGPKDTWPNAAVIDVMLPWTDPGRHMPPEPDEVKREGYYRAGLRCERYLRSRGFEAPIVLFTILERGDLQNHLGTLHPRSRLVKKTTDFSELIATLRSLIQD